MASSTVEVAFLPFSPGTRLEDSTTIAGAIWRDTLAGISQASGFQGVYWGRQTENPDTIQLLVRMCYPSIDFPGRSSVLLLLLSWPNSYMCPDWASKTAHEEFAQTPLYAAVSNPVTAILAATPHMYHVGLGPLPIFPPLSGDVSPVTELATFHFAADATEKEFDAFSTEVNGFVETVKKADGHTATVSGWVIEELELPSRVERGKAFVAAFGWESMDAQGRFEKTKVFEEKMVGLRGLVKELETHCVAFAVVQHYYS